jgi:hypothetical protein
MLTSAPRSKSNVLKAKLYSVSPVLAKCGGKKIHQYPSNKGSTSNLVNQVTSCWGSVVREAAKCAVDEQKMSVNKVREKVICTYLKTGKITHHFEHISASTYSNIPHSDEEKR